jgi:hypothetical protein
MIRVPRNSLVLTFLLLFTLLKSQETVIKIPFSQPKKLIVDAGDNQVINSGQSIMLGTDVSITGGSPDYQYLWKDDEDHEYNTPTISITEAGSYFLTVTDENHCSAIDSVHISRYTAIDNHESVSGFLIFPNPSSGVVNITVKNAENPVILEIVSDEGRVVYEQNLEISSQDFTGMIDLTGLDAGTYYIRLIRTGGSLVKPIIIQ